MMSTKRTALPLLVLAALFLAGCLKSNRAFVINPDGSGKVTIEETTPNVASIFGPEAKKGSPKEELRRFVAAVIGKSWGIELWRDVAYETLPDGRFHFTGTAYFRDYNGLHFDQISNNDITIERTGAGTLIISLPEKESSAAADHILDEAEIRHVADSLRAAYGDMRELLASVSDIHEVNTYRFAGTVLSARGFRRETDGSLGVEFDGKQLMRTLDSLTSTERFWEGMASGGSGKGLDDRMITAIFGGSLPSAEVDLATSPLFDYGREVAAGRTSYAALRKKLGIR